MSLLVLLLAAAFLGTWIGRRLALDLSMAGLTVRLILGLACAALITLLLGLHSLRAAQIGIYAVTLGAAAHEFGRRGRAFHLHRPSLFNTTRLSPLELLALGAIACSLSFAFLRTSLPITDWDATTTHLALPAAYVQAGRIEPVLMPGALAPHLTHALYTWAYAIGGEHSTAQLSWVFAMLAVAGVYAAARELAGRRAGLIAAAFLATAPAFCYLAPVPGTALLLTACMGVTMAALLRWHRTGAHGWFLAAGLATGTACGVGYSGYLFALAVIIWLLVERAPLRAVGLFAACAMTAALPWLLHSVTAAASAGLSPFALMLPHSPLHHVQPLDRLDLPHLIGNGAGDFVMYYWNLLMRPTKAGGWWLSPGGLLLWLGPVVFLAGTPKTRAWGLIAATGLSALFFLDRRPHTLLPWFALAMIAVAAGAVTLPKLRQTAAVLLGMAFVHGCAIGILVAIAGVPALAGIVSPDALVQERIPTMPAFEWLNEHGGASGVVLSLDPRAYYLRQPALTEFHALEHLTALSHAEQIAWLKEKDVKWILVPPDFAVQQPFLQRSGINTMIATWKRDGGHFSTAATFFPKDAGGTADTYLEVIRVF
jgi:RES domain-containing protein